MNTEILPFIIFGGFVLLFVVLIVRSIIAEKNRTKAWQILAKKLGLDFKESADSLISAYPGIKLFEKGRSRKAFNCISGQKGDVNFTLTDYRYTTKSGKNSSTTYMSLFIITDSQLQLPHFNLAIEIKLLNFFTKLLGIKDINFDEDQTFSDSFLLQGNDEGAVRALFNENLRRYFVAEKDPNIQIEAVNSSIIIKHIKRVEPKDFKSAMMKAFEIYEQIKKEYEKVSEK